MSDQSVSAMPWWYCSFSDNDGFRGGIFIEATSIIDAALRARVKGINPGGEMIGFQIPESALPDARYRNKLLRRIELEQASGLLLTAQELFSDESN